MSMVNMFGNLEKTKQVKQRLDNMQVDVDKMRNHTVEIESLNSRLKDIREELDSHVTQFEFDGAIAGLEKKIEDAKEMMVKNEDKTEYITKEVFVENLNDVTLCFQEYLNTTPRPAPQEFDPTPLIKQIDGLNNSIAMLANEIDELKKPQPVVLKSDDSRVVVRTSKDIDDPVQDVPPLTLSKESSLFKKPVKKQK